MHGNAIKRVKALSAIGIAFTIIGLWRRFPCHGVLSERG
jgi:hypothetical protein